MKALLCGVLLVTCASPVMAADAPLEMQISFPKEEALGTIHVRGTIDAPSDVVWQVVTNIQRWPHWMPMVTEARFLSDAAARAIPPTAAKDKALFDDLQRRHPGSAPVPGPQGVAARVSYEAYDLPWPIANEWIIRKYRFDAGRAGEGVYRVSWEKGYDRNEPGSDGYWELAPSREDAERTIMVYHFRVKAKRGLALALLKSGVKSAVTKFYRAINQETAQAAGGRG